MASAEIWRVLRKDGVLYFSVNLHPTVGAVLHGVSGSRSTADTRIPDLTKVRRFLNAHGFDVRHEDSQDYAECRRADLTSANLKDRLKALGGLSEFLCTCVATRRG